MTIDSTLERARAGDDRAFGELTGPYLAELRLHCYRMLGSVQDAEDAVQNALLRAWRGLDKFEGRSSIRSWLYSIATNTTLDITRHRSRRELPADFGPAAEIGGPMQEVVNEPIWLEPFPDQVGLDALLEGQLGDPGAGVGDQRDQALGGEHAQCLAHRDAAGARSRGDLLLPDPLARLVAAVQDRGPQILHDPAARYGCQSFTVASAS